MQTRLLKVIAVLLLASAAVLADPKISKISKDLNGANPSATVNVIVQFKNPPSKDDLKQLGPYGQMKKLFHGINAVLIPLKVSDLAAIASNPNITFISPDRPVNGALDLTAAAVNAAAAVSYGLTGAGVGIAVIDSGITLKNDLLDYKGVSRVVYS